MVLVSVSFITPAEPTVRPTDSPVVVEQSQTVPVPVRFQTPVERVTVLVFVLLDEKLAHVTLCVAALNIPFVRVNVPVIFRSFCSVTEPDATFIVRDGSVIPLGVRFPAAAKVSAGEKVTPDFPVNAPLTVSVELENVRMLLALRLTDFATALESVTVPVPELASNVTSSDAVGADAPPAPPLLLAQLVVVEVSHVPEPPTQ